MDDEDTTMLGTGFAEVRIMMQSVEDNLLKDGGNFPLAMITLHNVIDTLADLERLLVESAIEALKEHYNNGR